MTIEQRMKRIDAAFDAQFGLVRELRDAVAVTAELEARQSGALREHAEWLESRDRAMKELDQRIADPVSGFGEFMRRQNRPN